MLGIQRQKLKAFVKMCIQINVTNSVTKLDTNLQIYFKMISYQKCHERQIYSMHNFTTSKTSLELMKHDI